MSHLDKKSTGNDDLGASLEAEMRKALMSIEGMLPAKVVRVGRSRVSVLPMVQMGDTGGNKITRAVVSNVPVMTLGGGGIFASFPIKEGDLGFIFGADRDTSLFYQSNGGEDWPNTERQHQFGDGGFLPLKLFNMTIAGGVDLDGYSLQTESGSTFVTLKDGEIQLNAASIKIVGDIKHDGNMTRTGDTATTGSQTNNGKSIGVDHSHGGVQTGSGTTGGVV